MKKYFRFLVLATCLVSSLQLLAQDSPVVDSATKPAASKPGSSKPETSKPETSKAGTSKPEISKPGTFQVIKIYTAGASGKDTGRAGIGDDIVVVFDSLGNFLKSIGEEKEKIRLFIDGRKIEKIEPMAGTINRDDNTIQFKLDRNAENDKTWASILGAPELFSKGFYEKEIKISVGADNGSAIKTSGNFILIRIDENWFYGCVIIVLFYLIVFSIMVRKYGLLRDRTIDLSAIGIPTNSLTNAYSLGRFQMAFWFTLTVISFFFIWLITDAYNVISATVLTLMGISATASISAAVIDNSKQQDLLNQTITQQNDLATVSNEIFVLQSQIAAIPAPANQAELQAQLNAALSKQGGLINSIANNKNALRPIPSEGFFKDILQDANGVSFHRLQMFTWTLVMGMIFIYSVWKSLSMPDFDGTLLALQGITAGTYLGFKFPEKQS